MTDDEDRPPEPARRAKAMQETRALLKRADETWKRWSCPTTAECCQLAMTSRPPWLWPSEWALLVETLNRAKRPFPPPRTDGGCPFLDANGKRCTVYEARPLGCRTFFCHRIVGPENQPTFATNELLKQLGATNVVWNEDAEPKPLPEWIAQSGSAGSGS